MLSIKLEALPSFVQRHAADERVNGSEKMTALAMALQALLGGYDLVALFCTQGLYRIAVKFQRAVDAFRFPAAVLYHFIKKVLTQLIPSLVGMLVNK